MHAGEQAPRTPFDVVTPEVALDGETLGLELGESDGQVGTGKTGDGPELGGGDGTVEVEVAAQYLGRHLLGEQVASGHRR